MDQEDSLADDWHGHLDWKSEFDLEASASSKVPKMAQRKLSPKSEHDQGEWKSDAYAEFSVFDQLMAETSAMLLT